MIRRRDRGDSTVEVVVDDPADATSASPPARRIKHPWRWTTALVVVVALALAAVQWQRLGRDVDVVDAGVGWTSGYTLTCSSGSRSIVHWPRTGDGAARTAEGTDLSSDPQDIVTLTNRSSRTVTLSLADPRVGAFERDVVPSTSPSAPTPDRVDTTGRVVVPAGASARLRLVTQGPTVSGRGTGLSWVTSVVLRVTSLGVTTSHEVPLSTRIAVLASSGTEEATTDLGTGTPWSAGDDLCAPPAG